MVNPTSVFDCMTPGWPSSIDSCMDRLPPSMGETCTKMALTHNIYILKVLCLSQRHKQSDSGGCNTELRITKPEFFTHSATNIYMLMRISLSCLWSSICSSMKLGTNLTVLLLTQKVSFLYFGNQEIIYKYTVIITV